MRILDRHIHEGQQVLDAGCGSGFFSAYFLSKGCATDSLDFADKALQLTREATKGKCRQYLQENLLSPGPRLLDMRYDMVFSDGLFEHFSAPEQREIVRQLVGVLNSGGKLITFVPNRYSPWQLIRPIWMPGIKEKPFTHNRLLGLVSSLHTIESGGINVLPAPFSPDRALGRIAGMLLYAVSQKREETR